MTSVLDEENSKAFSFVDYLPLKLVLYLASPYIAGHDAAAVIKLARQFFEKDNICSTLDILGENVRSIEAAERYVQTYISVIDALVAHKLPVSNPRQQITVSMKPSMFSTTAPQPDVASKRQLDDAFNRIAQVVEHAFQRGINMTLEAEDNRWTNFQLETYFALLQAGYNNLGTVLQTRLFRTGKDIQRFDEHSRVRLVIGIYNEPASIAYIDKSKMKDLLIQYAGKLLAKGAYVELATHDRHYLKRFFSEIVLPQRLSTNNFETQFLFGVPRSKLQKSLVNGQYFQSWQNNKTKEDASYISSLIESGVLVRMYLPFVSNAVAAPYCKRRLRENHNLIIYGIKNILRYT
jgi:proline dehydrogenase